jgi:site-specific recombinase XerC
MARIEQTGNSDQVEMVGALIKLADFDGYWIGIGAALDWIAMRGEAMPLALYFQCYDEGAEALVQLLCDMPDDEASRLVRGLDVNGGGLLGPVPSGIWPLTATSDSNDAGMPYRLTGTDVISDNVPTRTGSNGAPIPSETNSGNLRWLQGYIIYLESHQNLDVRTVDEHLRSLARLSSFLEHKGFEKVTIDDARLFKDELRSRREHEGEARLSASTVSHTLIRCRAFFTWLLRQGVDTLPQDMPGYFSLSRREAALEASSVKGTKLTFDQALCIFAEMPQSSAVEMRNRAIVAMFIVTGIRIAALTSLRGKHVNLRTRWVNQDPHEVDTKFGKHIRTYCLNLGTGLLEALDDWQAWRASNGFDSVAPFFLPDCYLQANNLGLGYRGGQSEQAKCWKSEEPVQRIIKDAAQAAGVLEGAISSHDFRKVVHPFLAKRGEMSIRDEVALQLNFGHSPQEVIRKNYSTMLDSEREEALDELCRRALTDRSELELYLAYERDEIADVDPNFMRAKAIYERNLLPSNVAI